MVQVLSKNHLLYKLKNHFAEKALPISGSAFFAPDSFKLLEVVK